MVGFQMDVTEKITIPTFMQACARGPEEYLRFKTKFYSGVGKNGHDMYVRARQNQWVIKFLQEKVQDRATT